MCRQSKGNSTINLSDNETINQIAQDCEETSLFSKKIILNDIVTRPDSLTQQFEKHRAESSIVLTKLINVCEIPGGVRTATAKHDGQLFFLSFADNSRPMKGQRPHTRQLVLMQNS